MPLCAALSMGIGAMASPAAAAFAYVTNLSGNVSVIDTATNAGVATIPLGVTSTGIPVKLAVAPDAKHVYVLPGSKVVVIEAATNTVVATIPVESGTFGLAVTPDSKLVYVVQQGSGTVVVIDAASNTVVDTIKVGDVAEQVAIAPDGKHAYVTNFGPNTVSVIETAGNTVVATVPVGTGPFGVAVTPDGKRVYVTNNISASVSVIDTASNTVVATVRVKSFPGEVAVTPDGKHVYTANEGAGSNSVSMIARASNTVVATIGVGGNPSDIAIVPPPPGVPLLGFNAKLAIRFGSTSTKGAFGIGSNFIVSSTAPAIDPLTDPVTLQIGTFTTTIPPGSFEKQQDGSFTFQGLIRGVGLGALIKRTGSLRYVFVAQAKGANLTGTVNTVYTTLAIGGGSFSNSNSGATSVTSVISH